MIAIVRYILLLVLAKLCMAKYDADGHNVAVYWGQGAGEAELGTYCQDTNIDIIIISFVNQFQGSSISYTFGTLTNCAAAGDEACTSMADDIKKCQAAGVKVLLSLGGAVGSYGMTAGDADASATKLNSLFGKSGTVFKTSSGSVATIDGIDLDIEAGTHDGYGAFVSSVKSKFGSDFLVTSAPQCVYPDAYLGDALTKSGIDIAFIQFYNNYCSLDKQFNWKDWATAVTTFSNSKMKLYVGLPGSSKAAGSGYVGTDVVKSKSSSFLSSSNFGGFMVWDAVEGTSNKESNGNFFAGLKSILGGASSSPSSGSSSSATGKSTLTLAPSSKAATGKTSLTWAAASTGKTSLAWAASQKAGSTVTASPTTLLTTVTAAPSSYDSASDANADWDASKVSTDIYWAASSKGSVNTNVLWAASSTTPVNTDVLWAASSTVPVQKNVLWAVTSSPSV